MPTNSDRNLNKEYADTEDHRYGYDFDTVLRSYMMREFKGQFRTGKVLEMGCFDGHFTRIISQRFDDVTVIEGASDLIEIARQNVPSSVQFVHQRFEEASFVDEFESIFLIHTLEHLDSPVEVLRKVASWLTPSGRLFVAVPNANAPSRQIAVRMGLISENAAITASEAAQGHRITYAADTLYRDIRESGLEIHQQGGVFFKALANFQMDRLMEAEWFDPNYLEGCFELGRLYPDLCASIYAICGRG
jgi:2-polyprenyl-3-methyl-5-hydroxy-6-metoxy-1,4-benzoquinol methylase